MTKLDAALAAKLCAEAMEDDHGFEGRFFYDAERGDIGWIAKDCDDKQCDCEVKTNADGDQDCSHSLYDWEGEDHINEPIARMLNRHRALAEQLMAALGENAHLREFIAASGECARAVETVRIFDDNERYRAAFQQLVDLAQSGDHTIRSAHCSWCNEKWPHLDGDTVEAARQYAREHAFRCVSHPMRIERDALAVQLAATKAECERYKSALETTAGKLRYVATASENVARGSHADVVIGYFLGAVNTVTDAIDTALSQDKEQP